MKYKVYLVEPYEDLDEGFSFYVYPNENEIYTVEELSHFEDRKFVEVVDSFERKLYINENIVLDILRRII